MTEDPYSRARMVRHVLNAWLLLFLAMGFGMSEFLWILNPFVVAIGMFASGRIALYGFWKHSLVLIAMFIASLFAHNLAMRSMHRTAYGGRLFNPPAFQGSPSPVFQGAQVTPAPTWRPPAATDLPVPPPHASGAPIPPPPVSAPPSAFSVPAERIETAPAVQETDNRIENEATRIIHELLRSLVHGEWEHAASIYSEHATYRNRTADGADLRRALEADFLFWPSRQERIDGEFDIEDDRETGCVATFKTHFAYANGPYVLRGEKDHRIHFERVRGILKISRHQITEAIWPAIGDKRAGFVAGEVQGCAQEVLACETKGDFARIEGLLADPVDYFGRIRPKDEVIRDKREYAGRWPTRIDRILASPEVSSSGDGYSVTFPSFFRVENPGSGEWRSGTIDHNFQVTGKPGAFRISSQTGEVRIRGKGILPPNEESE